MPPTRNPLPPSLSAETAPPPRPLSAARRQQRVAVAMMSSGFTGLFRPAPGRAGADVAVLEAQDPAGRVGARNGGQVDPGAEPQPRRDRGGFRPDQRARMVAMSGDAPNVVFDLIRRHQITCEAMQGRALHAAFSRRSADAVRNSAAQGARRGRPVSCWSATTSRRHGARRYLYEMLNRAAGGSTRSATRAGWPSGDAGRGRGARRDPVTAMRRSGGSGMWRRPAGRCGRSVSCWPRRLADRLWPGLRRSIVPVCSAIAAAEPLAPDLVAAVCLGSVLYRRRRSTVYLPPDQFAGLLMKGAAPRGTSTGPRPWPT